MVKSKMLQQLGNQSTIPEIGLETTSRSTHQARRQNRRDALGNAKEEGGLHLLILPLGEGNEGAVDKRAPDAAIGRCRNNRHAGHVGWGQRMRKASGTAVRVWDLDGLHCGCIWP